MAVQTAPVAGEGQTPIIFLDDVKVTFKSRTGSLFKPNLVHAVRGLTIRLMPGETIGIVGESGCGKSTTANVMCGLQKPTSGRVYFKGEDVTNRTAAHRRIDRACHLGGVPRPRHRPERAHDHPRPAA